MLSTTSILALVLALLPVIRGTQYGLVKEYAGSSFFNDWNFYGSCELQIPFYSVPTQSRACFQMTTSPTGTPSTCPSTPFITTFVFYLHVSAT